MWNYKPCRLINCYYIDNNSVTVLTFNNFIRLTEASMIFWMNSDGKHTISDIVDILEKKYTTDTRKKLYQGVINILFKLQKKGVIISNWDPVLKDEIPQEVVL